MIHSEVGTEPSPLVRILAILGIVVGVISCCLRGVVWSKGVLNAEVFGYMVGGMFIAALLACLVGWKSKTNKLGKFAITFLGVSLLQLLLELSPRATNV